MAVARTIVPLVALLAWAASALAGPILDASSVSYDPGTRLYTYTYSLNELAKSGGTGAFWLLVAPGSDQAGLAPLAQTSPPGWSFQSFWMPGFPEAPGFEPPLPPGVFWAWNAPVGTNPADLPDRLDFSFTTRSAPSASQGFNYLLWNLNPEGAPEFGHVPVPDLAATPEPSALVLAGTAAAGWAWSRWRSRRRDSAARDAAADCPT
jgi:PEP-CTERM motif